VAAFGRVEGRGVGWLVSALKDVTGRARSRHLFIIDALGVTSASLVALALWLDAPPYPALVGPYLWVVGIVVATLLAVSIALGLYRYSWHHASIHDMGRIITCATLGTIAAAGIVSVASALRPPAAGDAPAFAFWLIQWGATLSVLAVSRFTIRAASEMSIDGPGASAIDKQRTLLYGAGWAGVMMARSAIRTPGAGVIPVGFLDDDPDLMGRRVYGRLVFGALEALPRAVRATGATALLVTMPNASGAVVREIVKVAMANGLQVRIVPPVSDLLDGRLDASRIRSIRVEDLLRRSPAMDRGPDVKGRLAGRTVVITGAAGSIGSELARQVLASCPRRVALVDQAESDLYLLHRDLERRAGRRELSVRHADVQVTSHLIDVTDRAAMARLFKELDADVVLHAAAYKHVPVLEDHPSQAVNVNIGGTMSVVDAAIDAGVERFVLVSTDKAVWPSSVMGASKRVAEMIVSDAARRTGGNYISVRFGNVLGSNGSVVPIFQEQLEKGLPLTITDPDMTRYFMTIPEAAWLIIGAATLDHGSGLYVLDMGEPVRIIDVARDLARLAGRDPDDLPIEVVGLRRGEKLHEELFYDHERVRVTEVPKVLRAETPRPPLDVRDAAIGLLALAMDGGGQDLPAALHAYVRASVQADEVPGRKHHDGARSASPDAAESSADLRQVVSIPVHGVGVSDRRSAPRLAEEPAGAKSPS